MILSSADPLTLFTSNMIELLCHFRQLHETSTLFLLVLFYWVFLLITHYPFHCVFIFQLLDLPVTTEGAVCTIFM